MGCIVINFYTRERIEVDENGKKLSNVDQSPAPKNEPSKLENDRKEHNNRVKRQYRLSRE